jgi:rubrerythrin
MQEHSTDTHPLSNLEYDWITLMQNKAQALMAYDQYIKDAEQAKSPECAAFFRKVHEADKAQLAEARKHLTAVMQGKMGSSAPK